MLDKKNYLVVLNYYNDYLWSGKTTETGWNYYGLELDYYFFNSVLSVDYLSIEDYFFANGNLEYSETTSLVEQYENATDEQKLNVIQNILNILNHSTANSEKNIKMITATLNFLKRNNIKIDQSSGIIVLSYDNIFDCGSYCNIYKEKDGILRKELKPIYKKDTQQIKRLKYEYENMDKLAECPQILTVYEYNAEENYYLMEQADMNLGEYLEDNISLTFDTIIKIIMDILKGMEEAHNNSIIHRDLHLGNILKIGNDFVLSDFGLSKDLSLERSLKSSYTVKNNHMFVDPIGLADFTKLDNLSDIYSIGKIMEYIFTKNYVGNYNQQLKIVIDKCIARDRTNRYKNPTEIIIDIEYILKTTNNEEVTKKIINDIINNINSVQVQSFLIDLCQKDTISQFIVNYKLSNIGFLFSKFEDIYQEQIATSILKNYGNATGFNGWANYDIFAHISFDLYCNSKNIKVKKIAKQILEECSKIRYGAKDLLDKLPIA